MARGRLGGRGVGGTGEAIKETREEEREWDADGEDDQDV